MNLVEKRDYIHSHLHRAEESEINEFFDLLRNSETLRLKLERRAKKSEEDIKEGRIYSRQEIESNTLNGFA